MTDKPKDAIAEAIDATANAPTDLIAIPVTLATTGRQIALLLPGPITAIEALDMIGWIAAGGPNAWLAERASPIVIARTLRAD